MGVLLYLAYGIIKQAELDSHQLGGPPTKLQASVLKTQLTSHKWVTITHEFIITNAYSIHCWQTLNHRAPWSYVGMLMLSPSNPTLQICMDPMCKTTENKLGFY